jgi:chaperone required for assembly of F1-ATPase
MKRIKRFYDTVAVGQIEPGRFNLLLNNKAVKTPLGENLSFATRGIAAAVATEWELQDEYVIPNTMPINTILMTHIDIDSKLRREEKLQQINRFIQTDTLRFPDTDMRGRLFSAQIETWEKVLSYIRSRGVEFSQSPNGIALPEKVEEDIELINKIFVERYDSVQLSILETASKYLKSGSTAIGLLDGVLTPIEAFEAAYVEELCQRKEWGLVEGDHDIADAETMLWLNGISLLSEIVRRGV